MGQVGLGTLSVPVTLAEQHIGTPDREPAEKMVLCHQPTYRGVYKSKKEQGETESQNPTLEPPPNQFAKLMLLNDLPW